MIRFISLLAHPITVYNELDEPAFTLKPSGTVARLLPTVKSGAAINGLPVNVIANRVAGLPAPKDGVMYIVSNVVAQEVRYVRNDILSPDTGPTAIRDLGNYVVGVKGFQRWSK